MHLPSFISGLRRATLVYLGLPAALFLWNWFWWPVAVPLLAALGWATWEFARPGTGSSSAGKVCFSGWVVVLGAILPSLALVAISGAGGWGSGDADWFKHDTVLYDLVSRPWPVVYATSRGPILFVYYTAFYLPAALLGKWTGSWAVASHALAVTMLLGTLLSLAWLAVLGAPREPRGSGWLWRGCLLFFGFSGMDLLGKAWINLVQRLPPWYGDWSDIEWWAQAWQYPSNAAALFWAPQHALGAWLPTALLLAPLCDDEGGRTPLLRRAG